MDLIRVEDRVINLEYLVGMHIERLESGKVNRLTLDMAGGVKYTFLGSSPERTAEAEQIITWIQDQARDISQGPPSKKMQIG